MPRRGRFRFVRHGAALAAYLGVMGLLAVVEAQQPSPPRRIGVLLVGYTPQSKEVQGFRQGLREAGYSEGSDVVIEWRSAKGEYDRVPKLAAELVNSKVDVIVVESTVAAIAAKHATSTIPIVMAIVADPLGSGLVPSLSHPGGNVTGLSLMTADLMAKRLQLLKETVPQATRAGVLWNPATPFHARAVEDLKAAAPSLSLELKFVAFRRPEELGSAFSAISRAHVHVVYVVEGPIVSTYREAVVAHASKARLPSMYGARDAVEVGGLMSYGASFRETFRRAAGYVDRILKGAKPGDLPIEEPTKLELVINLNTARALGLAIPQSILVRADELIK